MEAKFSGKTGLLKSITQGSNSLAVQVDFVSYGTVQRGKDKSGAYLFLPGGEASSLVGSWSSPRVVIVAGPLVSCEAPLLLLLLLLSCLKQIFLLQCSYVQCVCRFSRCALT